MKMKMKKDSKGSKEAMVCASYIKRYGNSGDLSAIVMKSSFWNNMVSQQD